jgi:predicted nucleic acid-binding protein
MTGILADTGPLYAAAVASDEHHDRAQEELARLESERLSVIVPYPIVLESYSLLLRRARPEVAHRWLDELLESASLINPTSNDYQEAGTRVRAYHDQPLSLFDGVLAVLSERLDLPVWTYDHHLDLMRVRVWR